jgi:hypothetical protein
LEITQREEQGLPDAKEFEAKILSQEEIFFENKLEETENLIQELVSTLQQNGEDITSDSLIHEHEELTQLQQNRDLFKKQLHKISVENILANKTSYNKTVATRVY